MIGDSREVPSVRIRQLNSQPVRSDGEFVLYGITAYRRLTSNFALQRACELAGQHQRPLVVFEALRTDYPWASRRLHAFVIQGMRENSRCARATGHRYVAWVEPRRGAGAGLMESLASRACAVVTDDFPCFFLPRMTQAVARRVGVRVESVDSNGLLPMRVVSTVYPSAYAFRRYRQKERPSYFQQLPAERPLSDRRVPRLAESVPVVGERWSSATAALLESDAGLNDLPVDQSVREAVMPGGAAAADSCLAEFLDRWLPRYSEDRSHPDADVASGLSP